MSKPWSISTTLRNPERIRDFLTVAKLIAGEEWNEVTQIKYQTLLIKNRVYGYGSVQFYNGLNRSQIELISDLSKQISYEEAENIFITKNYNDPPMRGRQSLNPLKKLGFVDIVNKSVYITSLGNLFLKDNFDFEEVFLKSLIKLQFPNPNSSDFTIKNGYDIKPFIATMHLINIVNQKWLQLGFNPKGISKQEFSLFVPTLIHYSNIHNQAQEIINLRLETKGKSKEAQRQIFEDYQTNYAKSFLDSDDPNKIESLFKNLTDYGDNTIRYFRLTKLFYIRGNGFYIDLEPRRFVEIDNLLRFDIGKALDFNSVQTYSSYLSDITQPRLPWETKSKYLEIIDKLVEEIREYEKKLSLGFRDISNPSELSEKDLKILIEGLREYRKSLQDKELYIESQNIENIKEYIRILNNINEYDNRPLLLEETCSLGLNALNDSILIKPNYPVGDDNKPTFTAPANTPDIECYYEKYNSICEVTMLTNRSQWYNEGQPLMRHLRDFEVQHDDKETFCIFVAPKMHRDTLNTFFMAVKYEYEGHPQKIIPFTIDSFVQLLEILVQIKGSNRFLKHTELEDLYNNIINEINNVNDSYEWNNNIPNIILKWKKMLVG